MRSQRSDVLMTAGRTRAFAMVEVVIATLVVGVTLVAALNTLGAARGGEYKLAERGRALLLARDLMAEIMQQPYSDPVTGIDSFGLVASESLTGDRSLFDDVDDYDSWNASPPQNKDGSIVTGYEDYWRKVSVDWVNPADLSASGTPTGVKQILVKVKRGGRLIITLSAFRTQDWIDPAEEEGEAE